jgi:predicted aconitase
MDEATVMQLDDRDRALRDGAEGEAMALAMGVVLRAAEISKATRLQDISFAHIDACFYNGQAHVDFARFMLDNGARLRTGDRIEADRDGGLRCRSELAGESSGA